MNSSSSSEVRSFSKNLINVLAKAQNKSITYESIIYNDIEQWENVMGSAAVYNSNKRSQRAEHEENFNTLVESKHKDKRAVKKGNLLKKKNRNNVIENDIIELNKIKSNVWSVTSNQRKTRPLSTLQVKSDELIGAQVSSKGKNILLTNSSRPIFSLISRSMSKNIQRIPKLEATDYETMNMMENHLREVGYHLQKHGTGNKISNGESFLPQVGKSFSLNPSSNKMLKIKNKQIVTFQIHRHGTKSLEMKHTNALMLKQEEKSESYSRGNLDDITFKDFEIWKSSSSKIKQKICVHAVIKVQTFIRQYQAINDLKTRKKVYALRKEREMQARQLKIRERNVAAIKVQNSFRRRKANRFTQYLRKRNANAIFIQCTWRSYKSRASLKSLREQRAQERVAVTQIQNWMRCFKSKREINLRRKIYNVVTQNDQMQNYERIKRLKLTVNGAALTIQKIQKSIKKRRINKTLKEIEKRHERKTSATIIMQNLFLHILMKNKLKEMRVRAWQITQSLIIIQSRVRQYLAIKQMNVLRDAKVVETFLRLYKKDFLLKKVESAEICIKLGQKKLVLFMVDMKQIKKQYRTLKRILNPFWKINAQKSATICQKYYRRHRAGKRVIIMKRNKMKQIRKRKNNATLAITLQRYVRGYYIRAYKLKKQKQNIAAISLQCFMRVFWSKKKRKMIMIQHRASFILQKFFRVHICNTCVKHRMQYNLTCQKPATIIQSFVKDYIRKINMHKLKVKERICFEEMTVAKTRISLCHQRIGALLLLSSIKKNLEFNGPIQAIYRYWASSVTKFIEGKSLVKMLKEAPGVITKKKLSVVDVDIIFAKVKSKNTNFLSYRQFVNAIIMVVDRVINPKMEYLGFSGKDGKMLFFINEKMFKSKTGKVFSNLQNEITCAHIFSKAVIIQTLVRQYLSKFAYHRRCQEFEDARKLQFFNEACIIIQCCARMYLSRMETISLGKKCYKKIIDPNSNKPYWCSSFSKKVSWDKPKIFGKKFDCDVTSILPKASEEFIVMCSFCRETIAQVNCNNCHDSFCKLCFESFHCRGNRKNHSFSKIPFCTVCKFQHGTRCCMTCAGSSMKACVECDSCFSFSHKRTEYHRHNWSWIIVKCSNCQKYAAQWRCTDCSDVYCLQCCSGLHQYGHRLYHNFEKLPYFTHRASRHYDQWKQTKLLHLRANNIEKERNHKIERERISAEKIQKSWRMCKKRVLARNDTGKRSATKIEEWKHRHDRKKYLFLKIEELCGCCLWQYISLKMRSN